ncbi:MAG: 50S ribosomal protein P1 [Candidatus Izemoplasmatales bacterium]|jgi:large subunit ribosomal protein L12
MEYVYAAMLLHSGKQEIDEKNMEAILKAAKYSPDSSRVKALVASIKNINIDEAIAKAAIVSTAPSAGAAGAAPVADKNEEEDKKKTEEEAAAGLGALFG